MKRLNAPPKKKPADRHETDIIEILAKVKGKVVRERIRVIEFLQDFDRCHEQVISRDDFARGLAVCRFDLTETEVHTIMEMLVVLITNVKSQLMI